VLRQVAEVVQGPQAEEEGQDEDELVAQRFPDGLDEQAGNRHDQDLAQLDQDVAGGEVLPPDRRRHDLGHQGRPRAAEQRPENRDGHPAGQNYPQRRVRRQQPDGQPHQQPHALLERLPDQGHPLVAPAALGQHRAGDGQHRPAELRQCVDQADLAAGGPQAEDVQGIERVGQRQPDRAVQPFQPEAPQPFLLLLGQMRHAGVAQRTRHRRRYG